MKRIYVKEIAVICDNIDETLTAYDVNFDVEAMVKKLTARIRAILLTA